MKKFYLAIIVVLSVAIVYLAVVKNDQQADNPIISPPVQPSTQASTTPNQSTSGDFKTYIFNNFHGESVEGGGFKFDYPATWQNNGQYFSPQKINFYDLTSVDAPVYFDLISKDLFSTSDLKYQITTDKRRSQDTTLKIDGITFKKYDLIDSGSSDGGGTGQVIIYLGPMISFNGGDYYLVFRWEEQPLSLGIPGNYPEMFEYMVSSLKFITK